MIDLKALEANIDAVLNEPDAAEQFWAFVERKRAATPSPEAAYEVVSDDPDLIIVEGTDDEWMERVNNEVFKDGQASPEAVVPAERQPDEWDAEITTKHLQDLDRLLDVQGYETWTFSRIAIKQALRLIAAPAPQVEKMREALTKAEILRDQLDAIIERSNGDAFEIARRAKARVIEIIAALS